MLAGKQATTVTSFFTETQTDNSDINEMAQVIEGNSEAGFMFASLMEFIHLWKSEKESTMSLKCKDGKATINFKCSLGHPDQPHIHIKDGGSKRKIRVKSDIRKARDNARTAAFQAAMASSPAAPTRPSEPSAASRTGTELDENSNDCKYFRKDKDHDEDICGNSSEKNQGNSSKKSVKFNSVVKFEKLPMVTSVQDLKISKFHVDEKPRKLQRGRDNHGNFSEDEYNYENYDDDDDDGDYEVNPDEVEKEYLKHFDKGMGNKEILSAKTPQESIAGMETNMMAAFLKIRESRRSSWGLQSE